MPQVLCTACITLYCTASLIHHSSLLFCECQVGGHHICPAHFFTHYTWQSAWHMVQNTGVCSKKGHRLARNLRKRQKLHSLRSAALSSGHKRLWQEPRLNLAMLLMTSTELSSEQATTIASWIKMQPPPNGSPAFSLLSTSPSN